MSKLPLHWLSALEGRLLSQCTLRDWRISTSQAGRTLVSSHPPSEVLCELSPAQQLEQPSSYTQFRTSSNPKPATKNTWKVAKHLYFRYFNHHPILRKKGHSGETLLNYYSLAMVLDFTYFRGTSAVALSASVIQSYFKKKKYKIV